MRIYITNILLCFLLLYMPHHAYSAISKDTAYIRTLNKMTGAIADIAVPIGTPLILGNLQIDLLQCLESEPIEAPETALLINIANNETGDMTFANWIFASTPAHNALEHPIYDFWLLHCT